MLINRIKPMLTPPPHFRTDGRHHFKHHVIYCLSGNCRSSGVTIGKI
jgi:hypothetical protein